MKKTSNRISARKVQGQQPSEILKAAPQIVGSDTQTALFFYNNGMVKAYPHGRVKLDIDPEVPREYDPALQTDLARIEGHLLVGELGYLRFEPQTQTEAPETAAARTAATGARQKKGDATAPAAPQRGQHTVRTKVAESAFGIVREGAEDFTLYMRAPKAMLSSLGTDAPTFFQAELEKLLAQMDVDRYYGLTA